MAKIGTFNSMEVTSITDFGAFLDGENLGSILLPKKQCPENLQEGDSVRAFIYLDSEDRLIATRIQPKAEVGQCATLEVKELTPFGAFLDWGLPKDLLVPFSEQRKPMEVGQKQVVYLFVDSLTQRITGSTKLNHFLPEETDAYRANDPVDLLIAGRTNLGYRVVVDNKCLGMVFNEDVLQPLSIGQRLKGFVKTVRSDNKIDLMLQLQGHEARLDIADRILKELEANGGVLMLSDRSSPEVIYKAFQVSKGNFKKAIGRLLKQNKISQESDRIVLR
ncbi:CvfB family protein [Saccharospirillum salsuginis]|uniref:GntR family transcriptional regulator n=1 Tax=Saccharospirillum salsuginis TaxID=418750 RepID=A0A918K1K8_9GAMM|nr:S1-like domain-containing RNA-binding protein [Saccharospirillum salsuginis]GGX40069.1 GntR family transcriptional regulator [Saccharospirillum salsuginis]